MRSGALSFLAGIMLLQQFAVLPSYLWYFVPVPFVVALLWQRHLVLWVSFCFAIGFSWALFHASQLLHHQLKPELISKDVVITGWVKGIPKQYERHSSFEFIVEQLHYENKQQLSPHHIQLNWYGKARPELVPGTHWQLQVRLKPPYGTLNPGGFDYEKYLFQKGIRAKGYVRKSELNKAINNKNKTLSLDRLRQSIFNQLNSIIGDRPNAALVYALAIGERNTMSQQQWQVLRDTGTAHLMAISGLHIGLVAALGFWLGRWGWSVAGSAPLLVSSHKVGAIVAIGFALTYALLAGWSIPTQRAFIMIMVVMAGLLFYRHQVTSRVLAFALFVVLFYDPLSVLSAGFWLSFAAVSVIAYALSGLHRSAVKVKQWTYIQWSITIGLLPLMLLLFQQVSIISPLANLWAIPVVSALVVPITLLAVLSSFVYEPISIYLLDFVLGVIDVVWWLLEAMLQWPWSTWYAPSPSWWAIALSVVGVMLLLTPRGYPAKYLSIVFFLPLLFPVTNKPGKGEVNIHLLDVGQGLSVVAQTHEHTLLFDAGPKYSERFDSGSRVVIPFLRQMGINKIDTMIVSHEDNDHIGGAHSTLEQIPVNKIITSSPQKFAELKQVDTCRAGQSWLWNEVKFSVLHPQDDFVTKGKKRRQRNNRSCVLHIEAADKTVLLTADIEKKAERYLVKKYGEKLNSDVLIIPHHGSRTSSSATLLDKVQPGWALLPVGYLNRYRLPNKQVMTRYKQRNIPVISTARAGAISFKLLKNQPIVMRQNRQQARRYWHHSRD